MLGFAIALVALLAGSLATLFWQMKRAAKASDGELACVKELADLKILMAAANVAVADKERAMNMLIAERDRLQFALDTVEDQRDELLKEALESDEPGAVAHALRDALSRLRVLDTEKTPDPEALPDLPSSSDSDGD